MPTVMARLYHATWQHLVALVLFFPWMSFALVDLDHAFNFVPGTTAGGCANRLTELNNFWSEADQLTNNAITLIEAAISDTANIAQYERAQAQRAATIWLAAIDNDARGIILSE
jgi:hypothetical protein